MRVNRPAALRIRHEPKQRTFYRFAIYAGHYAGFLASMYRPKYRLSTSEWKVMAVLGVQAPLSATQTGKRTSLEPAKVTRAVDTLVSKGFVLRRQDKEDRRRVVLSLSAKGGRVFRKIDRIRFAIESEMLSLLEPAELKQLQAILDKIERRSAQIFRDGPFWRDILARRKVKDAVAASSAPLGKGSARALRFHYVAPAEARSTSRSV